MLRSIRYGEADRILHLYTVDHGRVGAIAKGIRKTTSRVGGRLEPLGHVELLLHQGRGELHTVTGVELIRPHSAVRDDPYRLAVGLIGAEAMLRLFTEQEANERAFTALTRFLDLLDDAPPGAAQRPVGRASPGCRRRSRRRFARISTRSGSRSSSSCSGCPATFRTWAAVPSAAPRGRSPATRRGRAERSAGRAARARSRSRPTASPGWRRSCGARSPTRGRAGLTERGAREVLAVITSSYEEHGGFRLRTLRAG